MKSIKKLTGIIGGTVLAVLLISFGTTLAVRGSAFSNMEEPLELTQIQDAALEEKLTADYPDRNAILKSLPYSLGEHQMDLGAKSAILIDAATGNVIYEKNADEVIPPASMTKLFAMYVVDEEVSAGRFSYDQIIPVPEEALACNMPPHSSLMFLGEGQKVTLEELLLGLSICSGNDAAYALAYTVSGSMDAFIERMNKVAEDLGLSHTHFVESSGYSEKNRTTAREMAAFCKIYLSEHPDSLRRFHSVESFTYPKPRNMAPGDSYGAQDFSNGLPRHITMGITQKNTNPMLGLYEGCDGLKTGYIDESGYNLALTAQRNGTRFLSVTMKGPGNNVQEGQRGRIADGTKLMDFGFNSFADLYIGDRVKSVNVKVYGSKEKMASLIPAFSADTICVPRITAGSLEDNVNQVKVEVEYPDALKGQLVQGEKYGQITVSLAGYKLQTIPLVSDRSTEKTNPFVSLADDILMKFSSKN